MTTTTEHAFTAITAVTAMLATALAASLLAGAGGARAAGCSRPIQVPVAAAGASVVTKDDRVTGVYPDILRRVGEAGGCQFVFAVVPRARLERMFFETAEADLLVPASQTPERDAKGVFVPLLTVTPVLVTLASLPSRPDSIEALLKDRSLRGVVVRGFTYGPPYNALMDRLKAEDRLDVVPELRNVTRMVLAGRVQFTIVAPTLFYSTMLEDAGPEAAIDKVRMTPLKGLDVVTSGVYLSRAALPEADQAVVRRLLEEAARSGLVMSTFRQYYPPAILTGVAPWSR